VYAVTISPMQKAVKPDENWKKRTILASLNKFLTSKVTVFGTWINKTLICPLMVHDRQSIYDNPMPVIVDIPVTVSDVFKPSI